MASMGVLMGCLMGKAITEALAFPLPSLFLEVTGCLVPYCHQDVPSRTRRRRLKEEEAM
ncbi:hypothetical protein RvY_17235 [Ramazzottius varieornatus]|uniref:SLC26A/SulP transporter domain-containing protein n=1 Tax=Ramazzottius varieornatus TaxID=947166 RepID=A0A1D1W1G1_RAMVA|nr:hypothetical protein RvY_17235 [Ramazzottius varieornatus]